MTFDLLSGRGTRDRGDMLGRGRDLSAITPASKVTDPTGYGYHFKQIVANGNVPSHPSNNHNHCRLLHGRRDLLPLSHPECYPPFTLTSEVRVFPKRVLVSDYNNRQTDHNRRAVRGQMAADIDTIIA